MIVVVIWLVMMGLGLVLHSWLLIDARHDLHVLDVTGTRNGRRHLVEGDIRSGWVKVGAFGFFTVTGLTALVRDLEIVTPHPDLTRTLLLIGAALLVWDAVEARRVRRKLLSKST